MLGQARLGQAQLGQVRLGQVTLGYARLGQALNVPNECSMKQSENKLNLQMFPNVSWI